MRNLIDLVEGKDTIESPKKIWASTWTEWQDRDGIYLLHPGSNSCYVGFRDQKEAEDFAKTIEGNWKVHRHGRYKELTDEEAKADPEIRWKRILYNMSVDPIEEDFEAQTKALIEKRLSEL